MIEIARDFSAYGSQDLYKITLKPGKPFPAARYRGATLEEAQLAVAHYYGVSHTSTYDEQSPCLICRELAKKRKKEGRR